MNDKSNPFIADGGMRLYNALLLEIRVLVEEKYCEELKRANVWQRTVIRWKMRREIGKTLQHRIPKYRV